MIKTGACHHVCMPFIADWQDEMFHLFIHNRLRLFAAANCSIMSSNETLSRTSFSTLSSSRALKRLSRIVLRSLFLINAILLNDRSPEQFDTITDMYMRTAISTLGNPEMWTAGLLSKAIIWPKNF